MSSVVSADFNAAAAPRALYDDSTFTSSDFLIEQMPVAIYVCDRDGYIVRYNQRAVKLWGRTPALDNEMDRYCGSFRMLTPAGEVLPHAECPMAEVLRTGIALRDAEVVIERPDGSRIVVLVNIDALRDGGGAIVGAVNCFSEVTERRRVEIARQGSEDGSRALLEALPAAIYLTDPNGRIVYFNQAASDLWGQSPELGASEWCGSWRLYWPDGQPMAHDECPMATALKERRSIRGAEAIAERPDGTRVPFLTYPTPLWSDDGALAGAVNMLVDISERKRTERADQMLAAIVESSEDAVVSKDLNGVIQSWNEGAARLFGYAAEEVIGKPVSILIPADHADEEPSILSRIRKGERVRPYETVRLRKDGSLIDVSLTVSPIRDADGRIVGASKIARDITERKRAVERQKLLIGEIKHRIKNSLATVQAVARQTLSSASRPELDAFLGRLQALAGAHDLLTTENWNRAALADVVAGAVGAFEEVGKERFLVDGQGDAWIDADKASRLTMVLHELATNAIKYGALSTGAGKVAIAWRTTQDDRPLLTLRWEETGGPPVTMPERTGFGSTLIQRALEGEGTTTKLDFDPSGLKFTLEMSL